MKNNEKPHDITTGRALTLNERRLSLAKNIRMFMDAGKSLVWPLNGRLLALLGTFLIVSLGLEVWGGMLAQSSLYMSLNATPIVWSQMAQVVGLHLLTILSFAPLMVYAAQKNVHAKELTYLGTLKEPALWKTVSAIVLLDLVVIAFLLDLGRVPQWTEIGLLILFMGALTTLVRTAAGEAFHGKQELSRYRVGLGCALLYGFIFFLVAIFCVVLVTAPVLESMRSHIESLNVFGTLGWPLLKTAMNVVMAYTGLFCVGAMGAVHVQMRKDEEGVQQ
ncbi:MAG: hypothetical protein C0514_06320 [Candidatus Puniceispirillum sp.]|nr:hypothetical protein [Candidatus Puniceispirillum sp.]